MFYPSELAKYRMRLCYIPAEMKHGFNAYDYSAEFEIWAEQNKILSKVQCHILLHRKHNSTEVQGSDKVYSVSPQFLPSPSMHCQVQHVPEN